MAKTLSPPFKPRTRRACFSFAAYSRDLLAHLQNFNVPIADGLSETELSAVESAYHFSFPPDLRSILQEGLPIGPGFPNWRSSSPQQLEILTKLPILGLCKQVYCKRFWFWQWGDRPVDDDEAVEVAKGFLKKLPVLVPVFRHCYVPSLPCLAGNPVFYVNGGEVRLWSYDVVGFFRQTEFSGNDGVLRPVSLSCLFSAPAWAATEARRVEFWTELVERGKDRVMEEATVAEDVGGTVGVWWRGKEFGGCLEAVCWKLRDGGWKEEDVRDMMMMKMDGGDETLARERGLIRDRQAVAWHVRTLSLRLLRAGWSTIDVMDSLGLQDVHDRQIQNGCVPDGGESLFDFQHTRSCVVGQKTSLKQLMHIHSIVI